jgi:hypothetical protein
MGNVDQGLVRYKKRVHPSNIKKLIIGGRDNLTAFLFQISTGCKEPYLSNLGSEYVLQIPNTEENVEVHAEQIRSFAYSMMGKCLKQGTIANRVHSNPKEETRLAFFDEIYNNHGLILYE